MMASVLIVVALHIFKYSRRLCVHIRSVTPTGIGPVIHSFQHVQCSDPLGIWAFSALAAMNASKGLHSVSFVNCDAKRPFACR